MTHQGTKTLLLALLALVLTAVRAWAEQKVTVVAADNGAITASHSVAAEGTTVFLTIEPEAGYRLKEGSLVVEMIGNASDADHPSLSRRKAPAIGAYVLVTKNSENLYSFLMPATDVEVKGCFLELMSISIEATESDSGSGQVHHVMIEAGVMDEENGEAAIYGISIPSESRAMALTISIPATITDSHGNVYDVTEIGSDVLYGQTNVIEIILPETDEPIHINENAFRIDNLFGDDPNHLVIIVHTPLTMLDDYALMPGLDDNFQHLKVRAMAVAPNHYWTFSCGVDIILPDGLTPYYCRASLEGHVEFMEIGGHVVAANNGVLLACKDDAVTNYELTAKPNAGKIGYTTPATYDAKTYPDNLLEPVIKATHYNSGEYYILYGNEFHPIVSEGDEVKVPACRAVLHITKQMQ